MLTTDDGVDASDAWWMARLVATGDQRAVAVLYARYGRSSYSLARRICQDPSIAEDTVQEAFVALWQQCARFDPRRGAVSTWLLMIVHHRAVDAVRHERALVQREERLARDDMRATGELSPGADVDMLSGDDGRRLRAALLELPMPQRHVLVLIYYGGYTHVEVATRLHIPLGTVKSRCYAATRRLGALLGPRWQGDDGGLWPTAVR